MIYDAECPYCNAKIDIDHDDGYGYGEDIVYEQECDHCNKTFGFTTSVHYYYDTFEAPCMNGEEHDWKPCHGIPHGWMKNRHRCSWCDRVETIDESLEYDVEIVEWKRKEPDEQAHKGDNTAVEGDE